MRRAPRFRASPESPRLWSVEEDRHRAWFTEAVEESPAPVYGERLVEREGRVLRRWDPGRSKLAAALAVGFDGPLPRPGDRWLYLGASTGTTASHVADLVGPSGAVFALERSVRAFAKLLALAERLPNLFPIFGDARAPLTYEGDVTMVDGLYADIAQPDQTEIFRANAREFLRTTSTGLLVLKTASLGRDLAPRQHLERVLEALSPAFEVDDPVTLEPFHKRHFLIPGAPTRALFRDEATVGGPRPPSSPAGPRAGRRP